MAVEGNYWSGIGSNSVTGYLSMAKRAHKAEWSKTRAPSSS